MFGVSFFARQLNSFWFKYWYYKFETLASQIDWRWRTQFDFELEFEIDRILGCSYEKKRATRARLKAPPLTRDARTYIGIANAISGIKIGCHLTWSERRGKKKSGSSSSGKRRGARRRGWERLREGVERRVKINFHSTLWNISNFEKGTPRAVGNRSLAIIPRSKGPTNVTNSGTHRDARNDNLLDKRVTDYPGCILNPPRLWMRARGSFFFFNNNFSFKCTLVWQAVKPVKYLN